MVLTPGGYGRRASRRLYVERSPDSPAGTLPGAVPLIGGTDDPVVPPAQAERMHDPPETAGIRCDLRFFWGDGHGSRRADTLTAGFEAESSFSLAGLRL